MNRFEYLTEKYLDNTLDENEKAELEKYLALEENREYLRQEKFFDKILREVILTMISEEEKNRILGWKEGGSKK